LDVTWLGHGCFRLRGRGAAVVTDPYPPSLGPRLPRLEADLVTVSHQHPNHAYIRAVGKEPFIIDGPGEYEVAGVTVQGLPTYHDARQGELHGRNTVYVIELDEVRVCHLGDLGHSLEADMLEALGKVDVLLVPVGGGSTLEAAGAAEVARQVEPRVVIPMHYALPAVKTGGEAETRVLVLEPRI
jgi:L-ascorbate metabolism protein UlaG (beta-lactamase superfamily)